MKGDKDPFAYLYEERLWYIAANVDNFTQDYVNKLVQDIYIQKMQEIKEERSFRNENDSDSLKSDINSDGESICSSDLF